MKNLGFLLLLVLISYSSAAKQSKSIDNLITKKGSGFIQNKGQIRDEKGNYVPFINFMFKGKGATVFSRSNKLSFQFSQNLSEANSLRTRTEKLMVDSLVYNFYRLDIELIGANTNVDFTAEDTLEYYENYYNDDSSEGITKVPVFSKLTYKNVYANIDWIIYISEDNVKYDFVVHPGGDPKQIKILYKNNKDLHLNENGDLVVSIYNSTLVEKAPVSFQDGRNISTKFALVGDTLIFNIEKYNSNSKLIIDPSIEWATFFGGSSDDFTLSLTTDKYNNAIFVGYTISATTYYTNVFQTVYGGGITDAFITKFDPLGNPLFSTFYGGIDYDAIAEVKTDTSGSIYVAGYSKSGNGIANGGFQNQLSSGNCSTCNDAFLARFNGQGLRLWATYFGGELSDDGASVTVGNNGFIYLAGVTNSLTGISFNQPQSSFQGVQDGFVAKYNASGSLLWSRYIGGNNIDGIRGIDLDTSSNLFIYGLTKSNSGISTPNAFQQALSGTIDYDTYLLKLDENGVVLWGTYYGGPSIDFASQCVSDNFGNVYTVGTTNSTSGISNNGYQNSFGGGFDIFFAKFNGNGNQLWASYYGGSDVEDNPDLGIDSFGNLILVGGAVTQNINMVNPIQNGFNGGDNDAIIAKFDSTCALTWSSYFGGNGNEGNPSCAISGAGIIYIAGATTSTSGIAINGYQSTNNGTLDNFLVKISDPNILPPTSNFTANNTSFCAGNCVNFTNQSLNDSSWLWLFPGGNPSSSNLKNPPNICYQTSGVFSVSLITYNSAGTDTLTILNYLSVNPLPIALANSNSPVCEGQSLTLTSNSGTSYLWSGPNGFVSNLQNPVIINTTLSNSGIFTLVLTNNSGCSDTASISVFINSNSPIVTSSNSPVCEGKDLTLFANVATSYSWSGPNGFTSNQQNPIINNITISNSGTYSVAITNICGSGNASFQVVVNDAPNALVSVEDSLVCSGASIQLYSEGGVSYLWSGPNNYSSTLQNPSISSFSSLNSGLYTVVVSSSDGCTGSSNLNLTIDQTTCFFIPSVFTPNNDGINDQWVIDGIWQFPNCVVRVLNRWGQELFQSNGYANPWDGKFDGENCPIADYYYIIDLQNGTKVYTGTVTIKY